MKTLNEFDAITLRLKQQLGVTEDKMLAVKIGLMPAAFAHRKKRNSFPAKEVYALAAAKPHLGLDLDFIFGLEPATSMSDEELLVRCFKLMTPSRQIDFLKIAKALSENAHE